MVDGGDLVISDFLCGGGGGGGGGGGVGGGGGGDGICSKRFNLYIFFTTTVTVTLIKRI